MHLCEREGVRVLQWQCGRQHSMIQCSGVRGDLLILTAFSIDSACRCGTQLPFSYRTEFAFFTAVHVALCHHYVFC